MIWLLKHLLRGYRVVASGDEVNVNTATMRAFNTARQFGRGRAVAVNIIDKSWVVMIKGFSVKKEDK